MRKLGRPFSAIRWLGIAAAIILSIPLTSSAFGSDVPGFTGVWMELQPKSGPAMRLQVTQLGSRLQVRISYRDFFSDAVFGVATVENGTPVWTSPQGCAARFRRLGYDYDNPGLNTFTLSLHQPAEPGELSPRLVYVQETRWNVPCANNHPIGTERVERILGRR
jgi:hypothetical protein